MLAETTQLHGPTLVDIILLLKATILLRGDGLDRDLPAIQLVLGDNDIVGAALIDCADD